MKIKLLKKLQTTVLILFVIFIYSPAFAELKINSVYPTIGKMGESLPVTIKGSGFDADTRVSMSLDTGNRKAIIGYVDTPGSANDVTVIGTTAYVADGGSGLQVIDISNPAQPFIIGSVDTPDIAIGVTVSGTTAYVADGRSGLQIIDISIPSKPFIISSVDTPDWAYCVKILDTTAYVADSDSGLQVIDVNIPTNPIIIGSVDTPGAAYDVKIIGTTAYVADNGGLLVIDISIPTKPVIISSVETQGWAEDVTVIGTTAYVADADKGLQVIDVTIQTQPVIVGSVDTPGWAKDVTVIGTTAYVADADKGLQIIDISNPKQPVIIGSVDTPGSANNVTVIGTTAYVADGNDGGLQVIDISNPAKPVIISSVETQGWAEDVTIIGTTAYVADSSRGLLVIDISNSAHPIIIGSVAGSAYGITVNDSTAYVTNDGSGLQVIDIINPAEPVIIGSVDIPGLSWDVKVRGSMAYVAVGEWGDQGLQIIDISTPEQPAIIGSVGTQDSAYGVTVNDSTAYLANGHSGLQVIDVSNPAKPVIIGTVDTPGSANDVTIIGTTAYVADGYSGGLQVLDISNPAEPIIVGSVNTPGEAESVTVIGTIAYVADWDSGIQVIDISTPAKPVITSSVDTPGYARDVALTETTAYVADTDEGLNIVPLPIEISPISLTNIETLSLTLPSPQISGNYTIRVFNNTESYEIIGAVTFMETDIYEVKAQEKAVIIAGYNAPDDPLWDYTRKNANNAYNTLLNRGYKHENIFYLSHENIDADGDGKNDVDREPTLENLSYAIKTWVNSTESPAQGLVLYMVDHGGFERFQLNPNEFISAQTLDSWLDTLQTAMPGKLIFVYDACQSGSFLSSLAPSAGQDRLLLASASPNEKAVFQDNGETSFSWNFWDKIKAGFKIGPAFTRSKDAMQVFQTPLINDLNLASPVFIGRDCVYAPIGPIIYDLSPNDLILNGETSAAISVKVDQQDPAIGMNYVRAIIIPPGFASRSADTTVTDLPEVELTDIDKDNIYEAPCNYFTAAGTYKITISAEDKEGNKAYNPDRIITIVQNNGTQQGDINGDDLVNLADVMIALKVTAGMPTDTLIRPNYAYSGADVSGNGIIGMEEFVYCLRKSAGF
ncbi:Putative surface protein [Desulfonema limicola]|uniref:Surface protein n=1 Tax=Desulfonema limicola TaxID=45656 RepID=A0A975GIA2_9BACT|nr:C13 family peptidase [Desulfonema limicola]QTA81703.1 Putative surface protein [Desulfonema limicola]